VERAWGLVLCVLTSNGRLGPQLVHELQHADVETLGQLAALSVGLMIRIAHLEDKELPQLVNELGVATARVAAGLPPFVQS
jgi:hypothetical protein